MPPLPLETLCSRRACALLQLVLPSIRTRGGLPSFVLVGADLDCSPAQQRGGGNASFHFSREMALSFSFAMEDPNHPQRRHTHRKKPIGGTFDPRKEVHLPPHHLSLPFPPATVLATRSKNTQLARASSKARYPSKCVTLVHLTTLAAVSCTASISSGSSKYDVSETSTSEAPMPIPITLLLVSQVYSIHISAETGKMRIPLPAALGRRSKSHMRGQTTCDCGTSRTSCVWAVSRSVETVLFIWLQ